MHTLKLKYKTNFEKNTIYYIDNLEHEIYNKLTYFNDSIFDIDIYVTNPFGKEYNTRITIEIKSKKDIRSSQFIKYIDDYMNKKFKTESLYKTHDIEIIKE